MGLFDWLSPKLALVDAVRQNEIRASRKLLEKGVSQKELDECIGYSIHSGLPMVKLLIQYGANINKTNTVGRTPLHNAAISGYTEIVQFFLDNGPDINAIDKEGNTPLDLAYETPIEQDFFGIGTGSNKKGSSQTYIAEIIKSHGGHSGHSIDPKFRANLKSRIAPLVFSARIEFPTLNKDAIVEKINSKLNYNFPDNMPEN